MIIGEKYKRYSHYKSRLSGATNGHSKAYSASKPSAATPSKASNEKAEFSTPKKKPQKPIIQENQPEFVTPQKLKHYISTPSKRTTQRSSPQKAPPTSSTPKRANSLQTTSTDVKTPMASPAKLQEIGPTPQLSGKVLGILDTELFTFQTPTKSLTPSSNMFSATSKALGGLENCPAISTPGSTKRKHTNIDNHAMPETPRSNLSTPAITPRKSPADFIAGTPKYFHQSVTLIENDKNLSDLDTESDEDDFAPLNRRGASRGLSSIIAELRELQEQRIDEEEEILREIENEAIDPDTLGEIQGYEDELNPERPEGFKVYKKKGQKRTTRRHISKFNPFLLLIMVI